MTSKQLQPNSTPNAGVQESIFGEVILEGRDLAMVASWEQLLAEDEQAAWLVAVEASVQAASPGPLADFVAARLETTPPALVRSVGIDLPDASK